MWHRIQSYAIWLIPLTVALLPFDRAAETPIILLALLGIALWLRHGAALWERPAIRLMTALFACFEIPIIIAAFDAVDPAKSWEIAATAWRYWFMGCAVAVLLSRRKLRRWAKTWIAGILAFWTVDALFQAVVGYNLLLMPANEHRLTGIFGQELKFGPIVAILSPILFNWVRSRWGWLACFVSMLPVCAVVVMAGTRAGWAIFGLIALGFVYIYGRDRQGRLITAAAIMLLSFGIVAMLAYQGSPLLQQRVARSLMLFHGDVESIDYALSSRVPIWITAGRMFAAHPINGVGARGFRVAYGDFADEGDPWVNFRNGEGATHPHQLLLEAGAEAGTIGIIGLGAGFCLAWWSWVHARPRSRIEMLPLALGLGAMLFPLNTHYAFYSAYWGSFFWFLVALYVAAWQPASGSTREIKEKHRSTGR